MFNTIQTVDINYVFHSGLHLQYIGIRTFDRKIPAHFPKELSDAAEGKQLDPPGSFLPITTVNNYQFHAIAKKQSSTPEGRLSVLI